MFTRECIFYREVSLNLSRHILIARVRYTMLVCVCVLSCIAVPILPSIASQSLQVKDVLTWFPKDTQAILVATGPYTLPVVKAVIDQQPSDSIPLLALSQFQELGSHKIYPNFVGRTLTFAVEALGPYPKGQDMTILHRGFYIISFETPTDSVDISQILEKYASSTAEDEGYRIFSFPEKASADDNSLIYMHVCSPRKGLLMLSADRQEMHEILKRMQSPSSVQVALPRTLPEWKYVDETASFWALRHFPYQPEDPTSPFNAPVGEPRDKKAVGVAVNYYRSKETLLITYLSSDNNVGYLQSVLDISGEHIHARIIKPGIVKAALINPSAHSWLSISLFWLLGHAIPGGM
jgi:hypothetical protein